MTNSIATAFAETSWHKHMLENYAYFRVSQEFHNWSVWLGVGNNVQGTDWVLSVVLNNRHAFFLNISQDLKNLESCIDEFITEIQLSI
jgi:hypothetical protein